MDTAIGYATAPAQIAVPSEKKIFYIFE